MKICYFIDSLDCGGKERQLEQLIEGLINAKLLNPDDIMVLTMKQGGFYDDVLLNKGIDIKTKRLSRLWSRQYNTPFLSIKDDNNLENFPFALSQEENQLEFLPSRE